MNPDYETPRDQAYEGRALVAAFAGRDNASEAARALHDEGFRKMWIGVTRVDTAEDAGASGGAQAGTTRVRSEGESLGEKIGRFFTGESGDRSLYDELIRHGVGGPAARSIEAQLPPNSAILTVDGANHPELAAVIIERNGGHVLAGEAFATSAKRGDESAAATGSQVLGYGDPTRYARGQEIDEQRLLQLREERLHVGTERTSAGEVAVGKEVVEHRQDVEVPVIREEFFIERRPVAETGREAETTGAGEIGAVNEGDRIRIPLMREQAVVTKRPVVTEEVVIGKRQVGETQRVSATTREEKLRVDETDAGASSTTAGPEGEQRP